MTEEKVMTLDELSEGVSLEGARDLIEIINALEKNFAWKYISKFLFDQASVRTQELLHTKFTNQESVYRNEFLKGEIHGLSTAAKAPQLLRDHLESALQSNTLRRDAVNSETDEA